MRWKDWGSSGNLEDRRGMGGMFGGRSPMGAGFPIGFGGRGFSLTTLIIVGVIMWALGIDPRTLLTGEMPQGSSTTDQRAGPAKNDEQTRFVSAVLATTEQAWDSYFNETGGAYEKPKLVLFSGGVGSACGFAQSAAGPFYCPLDRKVYLDMSFFTQLERRFGAPGDFAQAYVIGHEIGHHVQNILGIIPRVQNAQARLSKTQRNAMQVRVELQADCFAGIWAKRANDIKPTLEPGDAEEALAAASAIGDDTLQKKSQGYVVPESFTHGSSQQRMQWFQTGLQKGDIEACNTFTAETL